MSSSYKTPGVYIEEVNSISGSISAVDSAVPAFVGYTEKVSKEDENKPISIKSLKEFTDRFGDAPDVKYTFDEDNTPMTTVVPATQFFLYRSMQFFYNNGGGKCYVVSVGTYDKATDGVKEEALTGSQNNGGIKTLEKERNVTLVVCPDAMALDDPSKVYQAMLQHCGKMQNCFAIIDVENNNDVAEASKNFRNTIGSQHLEYGGAYYPWLATNIVAAKEVSFENIENISDFQIYLNNADTANKLTKVIQQMGGQDHTNPSLEERIGTFNDSDNKDKVKQALANLLVPIDDDTVAAIIRAVSTLPEGNDNSDPPSRKALCTVLTDIAIDDNADDGMYKRLTLKDSNNFKEAIKSSDEDIRTQVATKLGVSLQDVNTIVEAYKDNKLLANPRACSQIDNYNPKNEVGLKDTVIDLTEQERASALNILDSSKSLQDCTNLLLAFNNAEEATRERVQEIKKLNLPTLEDVTALTDNINDLVDANNQGFAIYNNSYLTVLQIKEQVGNIPINKLYHLYDVADAVGIVIPSPDEAENQRIDNTLYSQSPAYRAVIDTMRAQMNVLPPSGAMAGIYTYVDKTVNVGKAPANIAISSVMGPVVTITQSEQDDMNVPSDGKAINAIRAFKGRGTLVWGARTLDGNSGDWRYINVRRSVIMIEESIHRTLDAYVFSPNTQSTWLDIDAQITAFLTKMWEQGILVGSKQSEAFQVAVGLGSTMTPQDVIDGYMRISVNLAVTRPAEFIVVTFEQMMPSA